MTVIAYKAGTMACDALWAAEGVIETISNKIIRLKSGALLGEAGGCDTRHMQAVLNNVKAVGGLPSLQELQAIRYEYCGLLVLPDKTIVKIYTTDDISKPNDAGLYILQRPYAAIGVGAEIALGAMAMGATARQAVIATCEHRTDCKLPVYTLSLPKGKK